MGDYAQYANELSPWYLVALAIAAFLWVFPLWRIMAKAGYPPYVSLLAIFPVVGLILLWWLAFALARGAHRANRERRTDARPQQSHLVSLAGGRCALHPRAQQRFSRACA